MTENTGTGMTENTGTGMTENTVQGPGAGTRSSAHVLGAVPMSQVYPYPSIPRYPYTRPCHGTPCTLACRTHTAVTGRFEVSEEWWWDGYE